MTKNTSNINRALALVKAFEEGDSKTFDQHSTSNYVSHWGPQSVNKQAILKLLETKHTANLKNKSKPTETIEVARKFEEGNLVVLHMHLKSTVEKKSHILFEVMRFENEKLAESWIGETEEAIKTASGHTMTDGETKITDLDKTAENKKVVKEFADHVLFKGNAKEAANYINDKKYIQHNPMAKDGVNEFIKLLTMLETNGNKVAFKKTLHLIGSGNFVFALSEGMLGKTPYQYHDLFRLENGKIVEHWDVLVPMTSTK